jgi:hypothetical protein
MVARCLLDSFGSSLGGFGASGGVVFWRVVRYAICRRGFLQRLSPSLFFLSLLPISAFVKRFSLFSHPPAPFRTISDV